VMKGQSSDGLAFFICKGNRKIRSQLVADFFRNNLNYIS